MIIQPRGFKRISSSASLLLAVRKEVELIVARYNCSKSYVIATILADALAISQQKGYYEVNERDKGRTHSRGSKSKIVRIESRKRRAS